MNLDLKSAKPFFLIAGPCVIESREHCLYMAGAIKNITDKLGIKLIFKASFDKANRTSINSFRGVGLSEGMKILAEVKSTYGLPVLTDVHETIQCPIVGEVCDILQIPAMLCRQTDLLLAAAATGRTINIKKGQFCNALAMKEAYSKICSQEISIENQMKLPEILLCDRGNMYGSDDLVVDFRNLSQMKKYCPNALIVQDITHSVQMPNRGSTTGGLRELIPTIARCAVAAGVDGIFMEVHDNPIKALSDSATQWPLDKLEELLTELINIAYVSKYGWRAVPHSPLAKGLRPLTPI